VRRLHNAGKGSSCGSEPAASSQTRMPLMEEGGGGVAAVYRPQRWNGEVWISGVLWTGLTVTILELWAPVLWSMSRVWWTDPGASHGLLVPPLALYLAWLGRHTTLSRPASIDGRGLLILICACLTLLIGKLGAELFLQRFSFVVLLGGMLWTFWGLPRLKALCLPLLLLITMIPLPSLVYSAVAENLQLFASNIAAEVAERLGVSLFLEGNVIHLATVSVGVAEACSGLRSLSSLVIVSLLLGVLRLSGFMERAVLIVCAVLIAIAINVLRVTGTAMVADYQPDLAMGFYHLFSGLLLFTAGLCLLLGCCEILRRLFERRLETPAEQPLPATRIVQAGPRHTSTNQWLAAISFALLCATCFADWRGNRTARCSPDRPVNSLDTVIAGWTAAGDATLSDEVLGVLRPTSYLLRTYRRQSKELEVLIVYFAQQRAGATWHSPKNCFQGGGWEIVETAKVELRPAARVTKISLRKDDERFLALYWYQSRSRVLGNELLGKILLIRDAIVDRDTSGSLVRITLPESPDALADAMAFATPLMQNVGPLLRCTPGNALESEKAIGSLSTNP
jgi:exosortase D (VPLPA-CTERM-specific)